MNSMSCMCVPTTTPKCSGRKSVYGRFCTVRSWATEHVATAMSMYMSKYILRMSEY